MHEPVFPSNKSIAFDQEEIDRMWKVHAEALEDQPDEWNPGRWLLWPLAALHWALSELGEHRENRR